MPSSGEASGLAEEVPSPPRSPHARRPLSPYPPPHSFPGHRIPVPEPEPESPRLPGWGPRRGRSGAAHTRLLRTRRARRPRGAAQPLTPAPDRLRRAGLGRAGRPPAPRFPAEADQARHKLPGALAKASRTGRPPAPFPRGPATAPAPTPQTRSPGGDRSEVHGPHPAGAPEFTSKSRPLFLKFLSRWLSSFSLSAMAGPVTPSPARAPRDPPQPPRRTDTPRNRAAA